MSLTSFIEGGDARSTYFIARWMFLRAVGAIYVIAFISLGWQVRGLLGSDGILPAQQYLAAVREYLGTDRFRVIPTVFWLSASDRALQLACAIGAICGTLILCNIAPVPALIAAWVLYLSLVTVGRDFLAFQWDALLLEAGFLAIFFAPGGAWGGWSPGPPVSAPVFALLWWLLFRLAFQSGLVKLTWADPTWRDLSALDYHFYTQPLPTWTAWYADLAPAWCKRLGVLGIYALEIGCPLLIFWPGKLRMIACVGTVVMQFVIFATGNYTFFNLLTIALAILLVDDATWLRYLPAPGRLVQGLPSGAEGGLVVTNGRVLLAIVVLFVSMVRFWENLAPGTRPPRLLTRATAWADPWRSINSYGLFRVMTTSRQEIVVEGSDDLRSWKAYEFRAKPGDVLRRPAFVEPHQPRLDWQMWFAALSPYEVTPWFRLFLTRLLQGSQPVLGLLDRNPFPAHPPKYVRATLYDYHFTTPSERRETGAWWRRTLVGAYSPVLSLGGTSGP